MTSKGTPGIGLFCGIVALSAASCTQTNVVPVEVKDITVIPDRLSALVSDQATLATELRDQDGNLLTDRPIRWESLDPSVVVVQDGVVTAVGPGQALVTASSDGAVGSAQVTVQQRPTVRISSELVEMEAAQGSNATVSRVLAVDNGGGGTLGSLSTSISYTSGEGEWLSASLSTTTAPTELTVSVRGRGLPEGSYEGQVAVSDGEASTSVTVALTVTEPPPEISLSPSSVSFSGIVDQSPPSSQSVSVTNGGGGNLNSLGLQIVYGGTSGWLDATLSRATAPATITLRPSTTSMEAGTYTATVQVTSPVADNRSIAVTYEVLVPPDAPTRLRVSEEGATSISMTWRDQSDNEARFEIQRRSFSQNWTTIATPEANEESYVDEGLQPETWYQYRVRACNAGGCSQYSNWDSTWTDNN